MLRQTVGRRSFIGSLACASLLSRVSLGTERTSGSYLNVSGDTCGSRSMDVGSLEAIGMHSFGTSVTWGRHRHVFSGLPLGVLLSYVGASGKSVRVTGLDDSRAFITMEDITATAPLLATRIDGYPIPRNERGPILLVYQFESFDAPHRDLLASQCVWHVCDIMVA